MALTPFDFSDQMSAAMAFKTRYGVTLEDFEVQRGDGIARECPILRIDDCEWYGQSRHRVATAPTVSTR